MRFKSNTNLAIHVPDLEKAKQFYSGVLGFKTLEETEDGMVLATGRLTLYVVKDADAMPFIPALEVRDLAKAKRYLKSHGGKIVRDLGAQPRNLLPRPIWRRLGCHRIVMG